MANAAKVPAPLGAIHHAAFRCRDAQQTRWFYEEVMGLPCAAGLVIENVPGTGAPIPYMHIFFEMGDGNYIAFFDSPHDADPAWFERKPGFDMHFAFQVKTEAELLAMQERIRSCGVSVAGPIDHDFVKSIYMYDPNGIQVEITMRTPKHDAILAEEKAGLAEQMQEWSRRTRAAKEAKFGAAALDLRGTVPPANSTGESTSPR